MLHQERKHTSRRLRTKKLVCNIRKNILMIEIEIDKTEITIIIVVYRTNEDEKGEIKDKFWDQLDEVTEKSAGRLLVPRDLNGRIGRKEEVTGRKIEIKTQKHNKELQERSN